MKKIFTNAGWKIVLLMGPSFATATSYVAGQASSIIPPLPEAASFFKSTDVPVSQYTGLPSIGIPFYTIQTKELKIPIALNYNARGIQVAEVASRTGIGWALQYGGMISRQTRGSADESSFGVLNYNYYNDVFTDVNARNALDAAIVNNDVDQIPDQFYFDVNGESGKFTIDYTDRKVVLQKFDDIKIVPNTTYEKISSWVVTDKLGNRYYYGRSKDGTREANDHNFSSQGYFFGYDAGMTQLDNNEDRFINTWHLMEIETYLNETISFFYELEEGIQYRRSNDQLYYYPKFHEEIEPRPELRCYFSRDYSHQYQISEIRHPGGKILFESDTTTRTDFTNTHALKNILVKNMQDSLVKKFGFNYFYQRCDDDNNQLPYLKTIDTSAKYRLFLSAVKEVDKNGDSIPVHRFTYSDVLLPSRFSNSQDNWGYYNGKANGSYLTFHNYGTPNNREVDTALAGAGLLKKITYPTGGSTTFTFEQNRIMPLPFINNVLYNRNNPTETGVIGDAFFKDSLYYADGMYSKIITIGHNLAPLTTVTYSFVPPFVPFGGDTSIKHYQVWLEGLDDESMIYLYPHYTERELDLEPGNYRLMVVPTEAYDPYVTSTAFIAGLHWTVIDENPYDLGDGEWFGAGKRIKKIQHWNAQTLVSEREYEYLNESGETSGKMIGLPNYHFLRKTYKTLFVPVLDGYGANPGSPLCQMQGNSLGYSRVTEYVGNKTQNTGKVVSEFTDEEDGGTYYEMPYHLPVDREWLRGKPLTIKTYKKSGETYELQKSIKNSYLYGGAENVSHIFAQPFVPEDPGYNYTKNRTLHYLPLFTFAPCFDCSWTDPLNYKIYYQSAGTFDLASTVDTSFSNGQTLITKTDYAYDYVNHYFPASQKSLTSAGDTLLSKSYFLQSLVSRTSAEQKLVDSNRITQPVKTEIITKNSSNTELAKVTKTVDFKDWGENLVLPEYQKSATNAASLTADATFLKYDSSGNPLEMVSRSGIREVYVWGYKKQYPVAKIVGSDYNTVIALVSTSMLNNADQYTDVQMRTELHKIRTGLSSTNALVTTFTYKPQVGMTSATDHHNNTTTYEYDNFSRLTLVRDKNNNILKKICYNYSGQAMNCNP